MKKTEITSFDATILALIAALLLWLITPDQYYPLKSPLEREGVALVEAGIAKQLADAGIIKIERSKHKEKIIVTFLDGADAEMRTCAWNDVVFSRGGCNWLTPGSGRGYIFYPSEAKPRFYGDEAPADWSKETFTRMVKYDADGAVKLASEVSTRKAQMSAAQASWLTAGLK